jgi:hypothetical protein
MKNISILRARQISAQMFFTLLLAHVFAGSLFAAAPEGEEAVESGKQALNQYWEYPWYDALQDKANPVEVKPQPPPQQRQNSGGDWASTALMYTGWTVLALLLVGVIFLMIRSEMNRASSLVPSAAPTDDAGPLDPDRVEELPFKLVQPDKDFYSTAEEYYREGDYSTAILYLYSYQLLELDRAQFIHLTRGKTNRQYLRETRRHSAAGPLLEPTMVAFEEVFFGHHMLSRERFEACWSGIPHFKSLLAQKPVQGMAYA